MKKLVLALGAIMALGTVQAQAQTVVSDTDGNGTYSFEELQAAYPDLKEATFKSIDVNADGQVDADELQAARESGTLAS
jgi:Ca2+-binding EF-hand superfamily protein